ncbi:MAG: hypothetical protein KDI55_01465 [Anaerolineae bacterium]|nr:hypothetical protein [Anaerolineae bacterium]
MALAVPAYDPNTLPVILCGPIVRRLTRNQVSVWVALSVGDPITLHVRRQNDAGEQTDTVTPTRIGRHVFLAVMTVNGVDGATNDQFVTGGLYEYWIDSPTWPADPARRPNWADFTLPGELLPTFMGLPGSLDDIILFHGSCRRAKGDRRDGLAEGYRRMVHEPAQRPHLLILSGDQIYADEVSSTHMLVLRGIADDLFGIDEFGGIQPGTEKVFNGLGNCPVIPGTGTPKIAGRSERSLEIGMTVAEKDHLWTLAEFYGTYLTVWSDVLWPDPLPAWDPSETGLVRHKDPAASPSYGADEHDWNMENFKLDNLVDTMPQVRKLLANTPTLMVFDDHEATDDWNLDYLVSKGVYNNSQGSRVITNALLAYLLFQHWGNRPDRFQQANSPEAKALAAATWQNDPDFHPVDRAAALFNDPLALGSLLGVPPSVPSEANFDQVNGFDLRSNLDPAVTIRYDFRLGAADGYPFNLVILDERTARHMPGTTRQDRPGRVANWALDLMWPAPQGNEADTPTVLIAPAPVLGLHVIEHILQPIFALQEGGERKREYEGWSGHTPTFEYLLERISQWRRVVILSGDVHFGYTHTLTYSKPANASPAMAVQFVASSFKYVMANTLKLHVLGDLTQKLGVVRRRTFFGYSQLTGQQAALLQSPPVSGSRLAYDSIADLALGRVVRHSLEPPAVIEEDIALAYSTTDPQPNDFENPDWMYTIEHVADQRTPVLPDTLPPHIDGPVSLAAALPSPWHGWNADNSATMVRALRASDLHQIGRVFTGLPVLARITFSQAATLTSKQELFISAGNDESEGFVVTNVTEVDLGSG